MHLQSLKFGLAGALICAGIVISAPASAQTDPKVAAEVMALARAQWASEMAGQTATQQMSSIAEDYTEFNGGYPTLIVGKGMAQRMTEVVPPEKVVFADMQNPMVQVYGNTAILTYNYAGMTRAADGKIKNNTAKSTRVYTKEGGRWMLVHANFAPVRAAPE